MFSYIKTESLSQIRNLLFLCCYKLLKFAKIDTANDIVFMTAQLFLYQKSHEFEYNLVFSLT